MNPVRPLVFAAILTIQPVEAQLRPVVESVMHYDGPGHSVDLPLNAVVDREGRVYVIGRSVGEGIGTDIAIVRRSADGEETLTLRYNSVYDSWDEGNALAVDDEGNIFVAGTSFVTSSLSEIVVLKYAPTGDLVWESHFGPDTVHSAVAGAIALDANGNIHVGGIFDNDHLLLRFDPSGVLQRSSQFGDDSTFHRLTQLRVMGSDTLLLAGGRYVFTGSDVPSFELSLMCVDTLGRLLWKQYLNAEFAQALQLDRSGNIVVISQGSGTTAKYSRDGQLLWHRNGMNSDTSIALLSGLAIDSRNNIIVGGYDCDVNCFDVAVMKYDENGNVIWRRLYDTPDNAKDFGVSLALDRYDNVYVTGNSAADYSYSRCLTLRFDSSGALHWATQYSRAPASSDRGEFVFVDDSGDVVVVGSSAHTTGWDYLLLRYRQDVGTGIPAVIGSPVHTPLRALNYPNPFNAGTIIDVHVPEAGWVTVSIFDMLGRELAVLTNEERPAGSFTVYWDGSKHPSGIYLCRLQTRDRFQSRRMILLK